ncbi:MAG: hydroxylamine oxidoreductase [bacterium]|nr:hydroxylamine oxidoreductase [bacterium]
MNKAFRFSTILVCCLIIAVGTAGNLYADKPLSEATKECLECHEDLDPGIVVPWRNSKMGKEGVGCYECHKAFKADIDAFEHEGYTISVIVSPKDCEECHPKEVEEMTNSYHAKANKFSGSLDNVLGRVVTGEANFDLGCAQCHGSEVKVGKDGRLVPGPWPNTGIGRLNPDGSNGSCVACHQRHAFSVAQAREPKTCGKCHQGPDHPQIEIYELSKHGIAYASFKDKLNMDKRYWVLGKDYTHAPTCVTCHMGATRSLERTHDVGARISWTLRPKISKKLPNWEKKRADMQKVCSECHQENWIKGFYTQYDRFVNLYNDKFAKPAQNMMKFLKKEKVIDTTPFNEPVEIDWWHLWHHEGRRARHGAAMFAPDWSHWHGLYEVALNFYFHLIPHANEAVEAKKDAGITKRWETLRDSILNSQDHKWQKGLPKEELRKIVDYYQKRYHSDEKK